MPRQAAASGRGAGDSEPDSDEDDARDGGANRGERGARSTVQSWCDAEDAALGALVAAQEAAGAARGLPAAPRWAEIAAQMPGNRRGKQCRDRYVNHLAPNISRGEWADPEERSLAEGYLQLGPKWAALSRLLPGRTENMVRATARACVLACVCVRACVCACGCVCV